MLQYKLDDDQGGQQPPKPPGWQEPNKPEDKKDKDKDKQKPGK